MKIQQFGLYNNKINSLQKRQEKSNANTQLATTYQTSLSSYPSSYYLNFTGEDKPKTIGELLKEKDVNGMPSLVAEYIEEQSKTNKAILSRYDIGAIQKKVFAGLKDCHTVEDIKNMYGNEECFKNLLALKDIKPGRRQEDNLFFAIAQAQLNGAKILPNNDDITTYVIKELFLNCKEYDKTIENLLGYIKDNEQFKSCLPATKAPKGARFFAPLGVKVPHGSYYGVALRRGSGVKSNAEKLSGRFINPKNTDTDDKEIAKKEKIIMIDAWNNSPEIRKELSIFMFNNIQSPAYGIKNEDFTDIDTLQYEFTDSVFKKRMSLLMEAFWDKNPKFADDFGIRLSNASKKYDVLYNGDKTAFENYINEVIETSKAEKTKILKLHEQYNDPYKDAKATLATWLNKALPLRINNEETTNKIINLLLLRGELSQEELEALQGEAKNPLFKKLVQAPKGQGGLVDKVATLSSDTTYRKILNTQSYAILEVLLKNGSYSAEELSEVLESSAKINEFTRKLAKGKLPNPPINFDIKTAEEKYSKYKDTLNSDEQITIAKALFKKYNFLNEGDIKNIKRLLSAQSKIMNAIVGNDKQLAQIAETILWGEYEKLFNVQILDQVKNVQQNEAIHNQKLEFINENNLDEIIESVWATI